MASIAGFWVKGSRHGKESKKSVPVNEVDINFEDYFSLSPQQMEASGKENEILLVESMAMIRLLESHHPFPPVLGTTAQEKRVIMEEILDFDLHVVGNLAYNIMTPVILGITHDASLHSAIRQAHSDLSHLDRKLANKRWLVADRISAADITLYTIIAPFLRFVGSFQQGVLDMGFGDITKGYPAIECWMSKVKNLRGYRRATDFVWRDNDQYIEDSLPIDVWLERASINQVVAKVLSICLERKIL